MSKAAVISFNFRNNLQMNGDFAKLESKINHPSCPARYSRQELIELVQQVEKTAIEKVVKIVKERVPEKMSVLIFEYLPGYRTYIVLTESSEALHSVVSLLKELYTLVDVRLTSYPCYFFTESAGYQNPKHASVAQVTQLVAEKITEPTAKLSHCAQLAPNQHIVQIEVDIVEYLRSKRVQKESKLPLPAQTAAKRVANKNQEARNRLYLYNYGI